MVSDIAVVVYDRNVQVQLLVSTHKSGMKTEEDNNGGGNMHQDFDNR